MSGGLLIVIELLLVFGLIFGFGFYELHKLRRARLERERSDPGDRETQDQD